MASLPPDRSVNLNWWRDAVFYQVYIRSFADADGDGVGDLRGLRQHLPYLRDLGIDALWITPFYPSPMVDHGYDVADPRGVDPLFGDLPEFDLLLTEAHAVGLRVTIDLVPNHVSALHPWFQLALAEDPGGPARRRFHFRPGRGEDGGRPPNNWQSTFGGPAWTRLPDGQWYLHLFAPEQPDLNWHHPDVAEDLARTMRFWLDRGVDGFRIDVAHGLAKDPELPDMPDPAAGWRLDNPDPDSPKPPRDPRFDDDGVHALHRGIRQTLDEYPGSMAVGEIWVDDDERFARYLRPDELHLGFNFKLLEADWDAAPLRAAIERSIISVESTGAPPCWVLSNHDRPRHVSRYGDGGKGQRRARAAALLMLALPGVAFLYYGEELGMPSVRLPDDALQDPVWQRSGQSERGRDSERVPMPWSGQSSPYAFSSGSTTWLPMPAGWAPITVDAQERDPASLLELYRAALRLRRDHRGSPAGRVTWLDSPPGMLAFRCAGMTVAVNLGAAAAKLPKGSVLLSSVELAAGLLPVDAAAWLTEHSPPPAVTPG